jgi:hypothetical protein
MKLYQNNINQFRLHPDFVKETWLLTDNTTLMTTFEIMNGQLLKIAISKAKRDNNARMSAHLNPER